MIITSTKFSEFTFSNNTISTNKERHLSVINFLEKNNKNYLNIKSNNHTKDILKLLKSIHNKDYLNDCINSELYLPAIEYLKIITEGVKLLNKSNIFCIGYPAGHHAEKKWKAGNGYSLFGNIAYASQLMKIKYGKVLIIDFDLHQGNGTKDIIKGDNDIFMFSSHNGLIYPLYGINNDIKQTNYYGIHIDIYDSSFENKIFNGIKKTIDFFQPKCILVSAGFDSHKFDTMGAGNFSNNSYKDIAELINSYNLPTLSILEGGYNLNTIGNLISLYDSNLNKD